MDLVQVDVTVVDVDGHVVTGLTRDDFELFEDGQPSTIATFAAVTPSTQQLAAPTSLSHLRDVADNHVAQDRPLLIFLLDDLHTRRDRSTLVKGVANRLLDRIAPDALVGVVYTSGPGTGGQELTTDREAVRSAVDRFVGRTHRFDRAFRNPRDRADDLKLLFDDLTWLNVVADLCAQLESIPDRRKAVVAFGEGVDVAIQDPLHRPDDVDLDGRVSADDYVVQEARRLVAAATRANVNIYSIDPRGLAKFGEEGFVPGDDLLIHRDRARVAQEGLVTLAEETGGFAFVDSDDFETGVARIAAEAETYYLLGFYPRSLEPDGRYHRISVRSKRPGLTIHARRGYVATKPADEPATPTSRLDAAMSGVLAASGIPLRLAAAATPSDRHANATVALTLEVSYVGAAADLTATIEDDVEFVVLAGSRSGKIADIQRRRAQVAIGPGQHQHRLMGQLDLPPGEYQLRAGVVSAVLGATGSVYLDFEVPDFSAAPVAVGDLTILVPADLSAAPETKDRPRPSLEVSAQREFGTRETLRILAPLRWRWTRPLPSIQLVAGLFDNAGNRVATVERTIDTAAARAGLRQEVLDLVLRDLPAGSYVLRADARANEGELRTTSRGTIITIR